MKKIKKYQEFTNEEISIKKALAGAALGASLGLSSPAISQENPNDKIKSELKYLVTHQEVPAIDKPSSQKLPSEFVKNTNIDNIRNMDSVVSIKAPDDFDLKETKINASFMIMDMPVYTNHPGTPIGGCIFINTPKIGFYVELKASGDVEMNDWVYSNTLLEQEGYSWMTNYGSYTKYSITKDYYQGTIESQKIFNIGVLNQL